MPLSKIHSMNCRCSDCRVAFRRDGRSVADQRRRALFWRAYALAIITAGIAASAALIWGAN